MNCQARLVALAAAFSLSVASQPAAGQPPEEQRVARLIRDLGASDFRRREAAQAELAGLDHQRREQLRAALESRSLEVRLRADDLLRRLYVRDLWQPTRLDFDCEHENVESALARLAERTGNRVLVGPRYASFENRAVTLSLQDATYWHVLDSLCRQSGNRIRPHYNPRKPLLLLTAGDVGKNPVSYCGPARARLTSARKVYIEELDYENRESEITHTFQLSLQLMWEDRFRLIAYRSAPEVIRAVSDTGRQLPSTQRSGGGWNVAGPGVRQLTATLHLQPARQAAQTIEQLHLAWELIAVGEMTHWEIESIAPGRRFRRGDVEVRVEEIENRTGARVNLTLLVSRDLVVPEPREAIAHENEVEVFDEQGRAFFHQGESSTVTDEGVEINLTLQGPDASAKPAKLRLTYPLVRSQRHLEIVFRDVPLPVSRPK